VNSSVFSDFLNSAKHVEERTASVKVFQNEVAAAQKHLRVKFIDIFAKDHP